MIMKKMFFLLFCAACVVTANAGEGALKGYFSVNSSGDKVAFSKGNLQYQASTSSFQFAEHQYDVQMPDGLIYSVGERAVMSSTRT